MTKVKPKRIYAFDAFFISLRTHFNFFRRFISYTFQLGSLFTNFFLSVFKNVPLINSILNIISHTLDSLAFGTNRNNSLFSNKVAFIGYGSLIVLGLINLFITPLFNPLFIPAMSLTLGLYFEGITIQAWFKNYKALHRQLLAGDKIDLRLIDNAKVMFYAASVTFASIALKAFALSLSINFPAAAICLFMIGQAAELCAILGSIGKEQVNFSRNMHFWLEHEASDEEKPLIESYKNLNEKLNTAVNNLLYNSKQTEITVETTKSNKNDKTLQIKPKGQSNSTQYDFFSDSNKLPDKNEIIDQQNAPFLTVLI